MQKSKRKVPLDILIGLTLSVMVLGAGDRASAQNTRIADIIKLPLNAILDKYAKPIESDNLNPNHPNLSGDRINLDR